MKVVKTVRAKFTAVVIVIGTFTSPSKTFATAIPSKGFTAAPSSTTQSELGNQPMPVTLREFEGLIGELAPKVNLFRDVWESDPKAEFYGGTSRDFIYWLKGRIIKGQREGRLALTLSELRSVPSIDIREFILYESDVDIVSKTPVLLEASHYGIKKIDHIRMDRFNPNTPEGQNELRQGYIPVEKIRLSENGVVSSSVFGDGLREIYSSKPTVHFASSEDFNSTHYAKLHLNHPLLLAIRFIRVLGIDYFQREGSGLPDEVALFSHIDPQSEQQAKRVIKNAFSDPDLRLCLNQARFLTWLNAGMQKTYRSSTNPTAANLLMQHFGADTLPSAFPGIETTNQYLFSRTPRPSFVEANLKRFGLTAEQLYTPTDKLFPDGRIYHGTRTEQMFRSILFQGVLPSQGGSAGEGLYGVASDNLQFAVDWSGKKPDMVVSLEVDSHAKIIDLKHEPGKTLFERFTTLKNERPVAQDPFSHFAETFGADILLYPYSTTAFVVKNGSVLTHVQGYTRKLLRFSAIFDEIGQASKQTLADLLTMIADNSLNAKEVAILSELPAMHERLSQFSKMELAVFFAQPEIVKARERGWNFYLIPQFKAVIAGAFSNFTLADLVQGEVLFQFMHSQHKEFAGSDFDAAMYEAVFLKASMLMSQMSDAQLRTWTEERFLQKQGLAWAEGMAELEHRIAGFEKSKSIWDLTVGFAYEVEFTDWFKDIFSVNDIAALSTQELYALASKAIDQGPLHFEYLNGIFGMIDRRNAREAKAAAKLFFTPMMTDKLKSHLSSLGGFVYAISTKIFPAGRNGNYVASPEYEAFLTQVITPFLNSRPFQEAVETIKHAEILMATQVDKEAYRALLHSYHIADRKPYGFGVARGDYFSLFAPVILREVLMPQLRRPEPYRSLALEAVTTSLRGNLDNPKMYAILSDHLKSHDDLELVSRINQLNASAPNSSMPLSWLDVCGSLTISQRVKAYAGFIETTGLSHQIKDKAGYFNTFLAGRQFVEDAPLIANELFSRYTEMKFERTHASDPTTKNRLDQSLVGLADGITAFLNLRTNLNQAELYQRAQATYFKDHPEAAVRLRHHLGGSNVQCTDIFESAPWGPR